MELDHDEPPDGEGKREEDGDVVDHHGEVDVEEHEDSPTKRHLVMQIFVKINDNFNKMTQEAH